ncbi:MAG: hypothetical protein IJ614_06080 [Prevotella sp.]|nr:hypothetical protein [Bacteroidaceae bacterium]MBR1505659.1 hypothetical protein [Prevotella sp.]MBR1789920.1 hypothetical protein [Bacteroidaceae bacterium]
MTLAEAERDADETRHEACYTINGTTVTWRLDANGYRLPTLALHRT